MVSLKHEQLIKVLLANEAYTLPPSLLKHIFEGKLVNKQLEEHPAELEAAFFKELLPELAEPDELEFFLVLGELAMQSFKATSFDQLPQQKVKASSNANLGNWQASSSLAKAVSFWAWTACRAPELSAEAAHVISFKFKVKSFAAKHKALQLGHTISLDFRGADCQLCFWGKQKASEHQPTFSSLSIQLGDVIVKLAAFERSRSFMRPQASIGVEQAASIIFQLSRSMIFSSIPACTRSLQRTLAWTIPWPSLSRRSLTRMMPGQLRSIQRLPQLPKPTFGGQLRRTCTKCLATPFVLPSSFLHSKLWTQQLGRELSPKDLQQQLPTTNLQAESMGACPACSVEATFHFT